MEAEEQLNNSSFGSYLVRYSPRTCQLVVSSRDPETERMRHVLVDIDESGVGWADEQRSLALA